MRMYTYASLSKWDFGAFRLMGPGLGNLLFPWARSVVCAHEYGLEPIWPTWMQIKAGPYLRHEPDKRMYGNLFRPTDRYVHGKAKYELLLYSRKFAECQRGNITAVDPSGTGTGIIVCTGMTGMFSSILEDHELVRNELLAITRDEHKTGFESEVAHAIAVHIRLGDFIDADDLALRSGRANCRIPMAWYVDAITTLRKQMGVVAPVLVYSDGADADLAAILSMPGVRRAWFGSSLADMLALSQARVLIGSSVFSKWASYLGRMPVVWYPGQTRGRVYADGESLEVEHEYGVGFSDDFIAAAEAAFNPRAIGEARS